MQPRKTESDHDSSWDTKKKQEKGNQMKSGNLRKL